VRNDVDHKAVVGRMVLQVGMRPVGTSEHAFRAWLDLTSREGHDVAAGVPFVLRKHACRGYGVVACAGTTLRFRLFDLRQNPVGLGAPVGAARKTFAAAFAEQAFVCKIGDPGLALGGA
jgi:hypothetical protein